MAAKVRWHKNAWYVFVDYRGDRRARKVGADKKLAKQIRDKINAQIAKDEFRLPERKGDLLVFRVLAAEWKETYRATRGIAPNTYDNYCSFIDQHLVPFFGSTPVADIDFAKVETFIAEKRSARGSVKYPGRPISDPSLRVGLVALALVLDRAVKVHKVLTANPARGVARFARPADDDRVDPFTPEELRAILRAAAEDVEFVTFIRFWAQNGGRLGEVSGAQNHDLDMVRGKFHIRRTHSPGRSDLEGYRPGPTKTRQTRIVSFLHPITESTSEWRPGVTDESRRLLTELHRLPSRRLGPEAYVFGGDKPWPAWRVWEKWRAVLDAANVRYRSAETLRHTFASALLSRNAPLLYVQKVGGWRSAAVLLRTYARWIEEALPAPPEMPTFMSDEQPAAAAKNASRRNPGATRHDTRVGEVSRNA